MKVLEERSKNESSFDALLHHLIPLYNSVESVENVLFGQSSVNPPGENYAIVGDSSVNLDEVQFIIEEPSKKTRRPLMTSARKTQKVSRPPDPIQSGENMTPNTEARPVPGPSTISGFGVRISATKKSGLASMPSSGVSENLKSVKRLASPEIVVDKNFRVGKTVKITHNPEKRLRRKRGSSPIFHSSAKIPRLASPAARGPPGPRSSSILSSAPPPGPHGPPSGSSKVPELVASHDHMEECEYCSQMFDTKSEVETHLETHMISSSKCADTFFRIDDVERHEKDDHHSCHNHSVESERVSESRNRISEEETLNAINSICEAKVR